MKIINSNHWLLNNNTNNYNNNNNNNIFIFRINQPKLSHCALNWNIINRFPISHSLNVFDTQITWFIDLIIKMFLNRYIFRTLQHFVLPDIKRPVVIDWHVAFDTLTNVIDSDGSSLTVILPCINSQRYRTVFQLSTTPRKHLQNGDICILLRSNTYVYKLQFSI